MPPNLKPLIDTTGALDHPVVRIIVIAAAVGIVLGLIAAALLNARNAKLAADIRTRTLVWILLTAVTIIPILAGRLWAILLICALSLLCYREFARATGLFRARLVSAIVAAGILAVTLANLDHNPALLTTLAAAIPLAIVTLSIFQDAPTGYIQRCALGVSAFLLFGVGLGRLGALAAEPEYRALLCTVIACCQFSDVAAYCFGKSIKTGKVFPNTSPNKSLAGHLGALCTVAPIATLLYRATLTGTMHNWQHCITLGLLTAALAQLGDLVISSIKRDIGVKDMGAVLPGHGGVLDRCNSLLLAAPAVYHYITAVQGSSTALTLQLLTSP